MATTLKRSITLEEDLDKELAERFPPGERSRFINDATRVALAQVRVRELLDEFEARDGPVAPEIVEEVERLPRPR